MGTFGQKMQMTRVSKKISQTDLAERVGVSRRSIFDYENGNAMPRKKTLLKIAEALGVTVTYLTNPDEEDPDAGKVKEMYEDNVRSKFGERAVREMDDLSDRATAFFAGGDISQADKDAVFEIMATAYYAAKSRASEKFTPHSKRKQDE